MIKTMFGRAGGGEGAAQQQGSEQGKSGFHRVEFSGVLVFALAACKSAAGDGRNR
ncbi:MAG: hypothetical protein ACO37F_13770 [Pirellulales bacterium]